jgi:ComEC/Rec2-related protein
LYYVIPASVICALLSFWKKQFMYGLIILLSAINLDLQLIDLDFGERNLMYSGVVLGEKQYEHHTKLLIHIDRIVGNSDTLDCDIPVEHYVYERNVFLGKRLHIRGKVRASRFAYRPSILSGHIVRSEVAHHPFGILFYPIRKSIDRTLSRSLAGDSYRIASGLILGGSGQLGQELRNVFSRAGILHILAVSGLHVGFVAMFIGSLLLFLPLDHRLKVLVILCGLILYAGVTGFRPSVCRATVMAIMLGLAVILQRNVDHIHIINITAIVFLLTSPGLIFDVGAQLSIVAVYGILYLYPRIRTRFVSRVGPRFIRIILVPMAVSFSAQVFVAPLIVYYFNRLPAYAVLSNVVIIPIATVIIFLLFLTLIVGSVGCALVEIIGVPVSILITVLIAISRFFASLPFSSIPLAVSPLVTFPLYFLVWTKSRKIVIWLIVMILCVVTLTQLADCLTIRAVNDCVLITTPAGEHILVCKKPRSATRSMLIKEGIDELDYLVAPSEFLPIRGAYIPLPDKIHFTDLRRDDLAIHVSNRVVIGFRDEVIEYDWTSLRNLHRSGRILYTFSNGEESHTIHSPLYGSIIEQMVLDAKVVVCRIRLLF